MEWLLASRLQRLWARRQPPSLQAVLGFLVNMLTLSELKIHKRRQQKLVTTAHSTAHIKIWAFLSNNDASGSELPNWWIRYLAGSRVQTSRNWKWSPTVFMRHCAERKFHKIQVVFTIEERRASMSVVVWGLFVGFTVFAIMKYVTKYKIKYYVVFFVFFDTLRVSFSFVFNLLFCSCNLCE